MIYWAGGNTFLDSVRQSCYGKFDLRRIEGSRGNFGAKHCEDIASRIRYRRVTFDFDHWRDCGLAEKLIDGRQRAKQVGFGIDAHECLIIPFAISLIQIDSKPTFTLAAYNLTFQRTNRVQHILLFCCRDLELV